MRKIPIESLIQLLGMVGIIGSLIFVGLEMRQSQRIALATQQQTRAAIMNGVVSGLNEAEVDYQSVYWENNFDYTLSNDELAYRNLVHIAWFLYENDYYQYTRGLMDDATWEAKVAGIDLIYNNCNAREIYDSRSPVFSAGFRDIVNSLQDECTE